MHNGSVTEVAEIIFCHSPIDEWQKIIISQGDKYHKMVKFTLALYYNEPSGKLRKFSESEFLLELDAFIKIQTNKRKDSSAHNQ